MTCRGGALHRSRDQIAFIARNLIGVRAAIGDLKTGFFGDSRSAQIKIQRDGGAIESASHIGAGSGNRQRKKRVRPN